MQQMAFTLGGECLSSQQSPRCDRTLSTGSLSVLNRFDPHSSSSGEAEVKYLDGDFRVMRPGAFVRCAVTGIAIPLEELKYWSVELQEAYVNPDAVLKRHFPNARRRTREGR